MEFRILGPLQVLEGGVELPLGSPKERALLAVLLLHARSVVSRERLIEELWGESPPATADKSLSVHVSQLRKTLACNGQSPIATRPPGYALEIDPERVDATRFEQLVAHARERVGVGEMRSAKRALDEALGLWRGPPLEGFELESAAANEIRRLEELRVSAQMDRVDCGLALGLHEQLVGELEALVSEHPLRERLRGQLMLALYRAGRQADALRSYRVARDTLVGELGIEPSVPLQRLEKAILNQDASLEAPTGVALAPPALPLGLTGTVTVLFTDAVKISRFLSRLPAHRLDGFVAEYQRQANRVGRRCQAAAAHRAAAATRLVPRAATAARHGGARGSRRGIGGSVVAAPRGRLRIT